MVGANQANSARHNYNITIREADGEKDAFFLTRQREHYFGIEYESQQKLPTDLFPIANWTLSDESKEGKSIIDSFGVIAEHTPTPDQSVRIGGGIVILLPQEPMIKELELGSFNTQDTTGKTNALFILNAVDPSWRGLGIGERILKKRLEWVINSNAEMAFAYGWERDNTNQESHPLFKNAEFTPIEKIPNLYAKINREACPDCNVWPSDPDNCTCDGIIWAKDIS